MIRIVASGDQHVDARHMGGEIAMIGQELALDELMTAAARANVLLLLGDLTHTARPSARAFSMWGKAIAKAQRENGALEIIAIAGNHEQDQVVGVFPYFGREGIRAITIPQIVSLEFHAIGYRREERRDEIDIACLPWLPDTHVRADAGGTLSKTDVAYELTKAATEILRGFLAKRREGVPMILATHATIAGAETSSGWNMGYRPSTGYVIPMEELEGFALVLAGHIHRHQAVGEARHAVYTGSLTPLDFSETEPKGYLDATIELESGRVDWKFEPLTNHPAKVGTLEKTVTDERGRGVLEALLSSYAWPTLSRFRLTCDEQTAREFPASRIRAAMLAAGARMAQVELNVIRADRARDASLTDDLSPMAALEHHLEGRDVDVAGIRELAKTAIADAVIDSGANGVGDLRVSRLEAENFLGLANAIVELEGIELLTLFAPVGGGKSSLGCDVIRFALFGESRIGGKASERLIRQGEDQGFAAVELESADRRYRIVRTLKRGSAGRVTTTLDVLTDDDSTTYGHGLSLTTVHAWRPLSDGKIASGEEQISRILGGLTDDVLAVANLVVQRDADRFSAARPEERKRLIAKAAGLDVFDTLSDASAKRRTGVDAEIRELHASAEPLRARAAVLPRLEADLETEKTAATAREAKVKDLERQHLEISEDIETREKAAAEFEAAVVAFRTADAELLELTRERDRWEQEKSVAAATLEGKGEIDQARTQIEIQRASIVELEARSVSEGVDYDAHVRARQKKSGLELQLAGIRERRRGSARDIAGKIDAATKQRDRLKASECPVIEKIDSGALAPCRFLRDAVVDASLITTLENELAIASEPDDVETRLVNEILDFPIPPAPDQEKTRQELATSRSAARQLERILERVADIARAEEISRQYDEARSRLDPKLEAKTPIWKDLQTKVRELQEAEPREQLEKLRRMLADVDVLSRAARKDVQEGSQRIGVLEGRVQTMREAAEELVGLEERVSGAAGRVAGWKLLVDAWKACRVAVLENAVIPSLEDLANEVLRQFPYGIQIALNTQRDRKSGDGVSETLEIEVLGAGQVYELCSGGQKTTIDLAFHVAIALLVSRRISTRLRFLYLDEPEGLDEPGRIALANLVRWIHDAHQLTVILASHHEDLIDAVGGARIPITGEPGRAFVGQGDD